jgi:diguanylate cyclase (GGDEF)-like protein/PAS domain S-box-containing protein
LGPLDQWPPTLRTTLSTILGSPVPMALFWGPNGNRPPQRRVCEAGRWEAAPGLAGPPLAEAWPELASVHGNVLSEVLAGGRLSRREVELQVDRGGSLEQAFLDIDFSPVRGEDGRPAGVMALMVDVTAAVRAARALRDAEAQSREDAERMQLALDAGAVLGIWNWDLAGGRFMADERYAQSFGFDPIACQTGLTPDAVVQTVHPDDRPGLNAAVTEALARGGAYSHQCRVRLADGRLCWVEGRGRVDLAPDGTPLRFLGVTLDADRRRAAETERDRTQRLLETFVEAVPGVVYAKDLEGRVLLANRGYAEDVGRPLQDCLGRTEDELLSSADAAEVIRSTDRRIMDRGVAEQIEERIVYRDRPAAIWLSTKAPLRDGAGQVVGLVGSSIDITARKAVEAALAESEKRFRNMADHAPIMLWVTDPSGACLYLSRRWHEFTGQSPEDALASGWADIIHPEDRAPAEAVFAAANADPAPIRLDYRMRRADGEWRWVIDTAAPRFGPGSEFLGFIGSVIDITDRKVAEAALAESEERFRNMADHSPAIMWMTDPEGRNTYLNVHWFELTGQTQTEIENYGWLEAIHPEDRPACERLFIEAQDSRSPFRVEFRIRTKKAGWRWVLDAATPRWDGDGAFQGFVGSMIDITDRRVAEAALAESEQRFRNMADHSPVMLWVTDASGASIYQNKVWLDFTGQASKDALGFGWLEAIDPADRAQTERTFLDANARRAPLRVEHRVRRADGAWRWVIDTAVPRYGPAGDFLGFIGSVIDITERKETEQALEQSRMRAEYAARHDSLTGLANRQWFRRCLERHLEGGTWKGLTALLFLDLDAFKSVNDSFGHPAGDELLVQAGQRLQSCLSPFEVIARFGGDEFAILLSDASGEDEVAALAERIIGCLSEPYLLDGREVVVGVSIGIGIALDRASGAMADDLLKKADISLYRAKADGRGVFRFFEPAMEEAAKRNQTLRADLRDALARGEFLIHYQPVVELGSLKVTGFEALLRWRHPRQGLLSPGEFIAVAEETGDIEGIGAWVLKEACSRAAGWPAGIFVSVNLSARQFRGDGLVLTVSDALRASGLAPGRLQLEITESLLLHDGEAVRGTLNTLRAWGVRISIDDFGTGYSSLGYLRTFSVDNIKIDRSFVKDLGDNSRTTAILEAVLALADQLGVSLTAEGIETEAQAERLQAMGCRQGQGYLFSRAVPAEKVGWIILRSQAHRPEPPAQS